MKPGLSANTAAQAKRNTISPICLLRPSLRTLAATIKARWICEQAHQQLKEELGARSLRRAILARSSPPCAHDDARLRLPAAPSPQNSEAGKKNQWTAASTKLAGRPSRHRRAHRSTAIETMPALPKMDWHRACSLNKSAKVVLGPRLIKPTIQERRRGKQMLWAVSDEKRTNQSRRYSDTQPTPRFFSSAAYLL